MVAAHAEYAGAREAAVSPCGESGRAAAEVDDERAVALVLWREDRVRGARAGEAGFRDLELRCVRGGAGVVDALRGAVYAQGTELQQVAVHALGGGDVAEFVETVGYRMQLELRALRREVRLLRARVDLGDVVVMHESALELPLRVHQCGAHLRPGDREACVADRVAGLLLELLQDGFDGVARLGHLYDLALAHSRRRNAS